MNRSRLAAATVTAAMAPSVRVSDLQANQASNDAAIGDCAGRVPAVGANVLTASTSTASALVSNLLSASAAALSAERATEPSLTQALAVAT
ncbi:hypothetical protein ACFXPT_38715 [Streptomyces goshikiensis]|uniref:hypothetical protein n=1 Tax=Streptomyces goshikiensis TaxID=1942 RepID=UPI0036BF6992